MAVLNLANLDGSNGFRLDGVSENDFLGVSVSNAGDVNGDGFGDFIIGAPGDNSNGLFSGASYVVFGKAAGFEATMNLSDLDGSNGFRLDGHSPTGQSSEVGASVSTAGDINGDGLDDLVVGDPMAGGSYYRYGPLEYGTSYVIFGRTSGFEAALDLSNLDGNNGFSVEGESPLNHFGNSVSTAGDINGDGFDDLFVGAPGADSSYIVFGKASGFDAALGLSSLDGSNGFKLIGEFANGRSGQSVSNAGDVNGDGIDDVIIGDFLADGNAVNSGASYVVFGTTAEFDAVMNLSSLNGSNGFRLDGTSEYDDSGSSVSTAGDVNGDGFDDLIVGASSASYVVFGKASGFDATVNLSGLNGSNGFRLNGARDSVSTAGDVNGDGFDDVIIGESMAGPNGDRPGSSFVLFGKASGFDAVIDLLSLQDSEGLRFEGIAHYDRSGASVSTAGDINGDGFGDLIVGAPNADVNGENAGASYVIFGRQEFTSQTIYTGTAGDDILTGTTIAERFEAGDGNDRLIGHGGADTFEGGAGDDRIVVPDLSFLSVDGGTGIDTLELAMAGLNLNLADVHSAINSIEGIDLTGVGDNTLTLTLQDLRNLSSTTDTFTVNGNDGDHIVGLADGWIDEGRDGSYHVFTNAGTTLRVNSAVSTDVLVRNVNSLGNLNGNNGFRLDGEAGDLSGYSVSTAGDVNGDGFDDVIVGAYGADPNGHASGSSYVVFGKESGFAANMDLSSLDGTNGFRLDGEAASDGSGSSVSAAGDVNGDGFDDVMVGIGGSAANGGFSGSSYVVFGKASGFESTINLSSLDGDNGFSLEGEIAAYSFSPRSVNTAGDVNGDGFDDMIIGTTFTDPNGAYSGSSYVVFGKSTGFNASIDLSSLDGKNGFRLNGEREGDDLGASVSTAGDVNGDGFDDVIVGAEKADANGNLSGSCYVVFGKAAGFNATVDLASLDGSNGFRLDGEGAGDFLGRSVSAAGDVNKDGFDDMIVGAFGTNPNGENTGSSYVVFGKSTGFIASIDLSSLDGTNGFRLDGEAEGDLSGYSVSTAGDVNGDGFDDVIVGSFRADTNGIDSGSSYIVFGKAGGFNAIINLSTLDSGSGFRLDGEGKGDFSGRSVSAAGDVNKDGFGDLIVGANYTDSNGESSGSTYIIFGRSDFGDGELPTIPGTSGDDVLRGTTAAELIDGGDGNDILIGRGGEDVFRGGAGVDQIKVPDLNFASIDGGTGTDILHLDGKDLHLDLANIGDKIQNIETICIYGRGDNMLSLTADSVLDLSDTSNTLTLHGNAGDHVTVQDDGWVDGGVKGFYHTYTNDDAVLLVGANLTIDFV